MADYIGSEDFVFVRGVVPPWQRHLRTLTREELDGAAFLELGSRSDQFELVAGRDYQNASNETSKLTTYAGMVGTVVSVQHYGVTVANVFIMAVRPVEEGRVISAVAVGGIGGYSRWLETVWTCQKIQS